MDKNAGKRAEGFSGYIEEQILSRDGTMPINEVHVDNSRMRVQGNGVTEATPILEGIKTYLVEHDTESASLTKVSDRHSSIGKEYYRASSIVCPDMLDELQSVVEKETATSLTKTTLNAVIRVLIFLWMVRYKAVFFRTPSFTDAKRSLIESDVLYEMLFESASCSLYFRHCVTG